MGRLSCREVERNGNWRGEAIICMLWASFSAKRAGDDPWHDVHSSYWTEQCERPRGLNATHGGFHGVLLLKVV